jgi:hypothetical protein
VSRVTSVNGIAVLLVSVVFSGEEWDMLIDTSGRLGEEHARDLRCAAAAYRTAKIGRVARRRARQRARGNTD